MTSNVNVLHSETVFFDYVLSLTTICLIFDVFADDSAPATVNIVDLDAGLTRLDFRAIPAQQTAEHRLREMTQRFRSAANIARLHIGYSRLGHMTDRIIVSDVRKTVPCQLDMTANTGGSAFMLVQRAPT